MDQRSNHEQPRSGDPVASADRPAERTEAKKRSWLKTACFSVLGVGVLLAAGFAGMHYETLRNVASPLAAAETEEARDTNETNENLADSPFLQHAQQAGLEACSTVFPVLGELLTNGTRYSVRSSWSGESPDDHVVQALVGMNYLTEDYDAPAAGVVFAAPTGSACEGAMVRVAPIASPCTDVPPILPEGSELTETLGEVAIYALGEWGDNALLLPTGDTCVVISVASAAE